MINKYICYFAKTWGGSTGYKRTNEEIAKQIGGVSSATVTRYINDIKDFGAHKVKEELERRQKQKETYKLFNEESYKTENTYELFD
jgi:hypothetical protein